MFLQQAPDVCPSTISEKTEIRHLPEGRILISNLLYTAKEDFSCFSIAVTLFRNGEPEDMRLIEDFTRNPETAQSLFRKITDGTVTPCTLCDVLEDLLE